MSFSSTLAASLLASEPESVIGEWLPSSLAGAEVVAMVEKSQRFLIVGRVLWGESWRWGRRTKANSYSRTRRC